MSATNPRRTSIGHLEVGAETAFGELATNFDYMKAMPVDRGSLEVTVLPDEHQRQGDYKTAPVIGNRRGSIEIAKYLHGFSTALPAGAPSFTDPSNSGATAFDALLALLASGLGGLVSSGFNSAANLGASGSPVDTLTCDDLSSFQVGQAVVWATGDAKLPYEMGWLTDIDSAPTPHTAGLLATPRFDPQGSNLWGSHTLFHHLNDLFHDGSTKAFSMRYTGHGPDDRQQMIGCRPTSIRVNLTVGDTPKLNITMGVGHFDDQDPGASPAVQSWSFPLQEKVAQWNVLLGAPGSTRRLLTKSIDIDFGLTVEPVDGGEGESGVQGWFVSMRQPTVSLSVYRQKAYEVDDFYSQTARPLTIQAGSQPGKMFGFCMPAARLSSAYPNPSDDAGRVVSNLVFEAHQYTGDTGSAGSNPINSIFRMAFA